MPNFCAIIGYVWVSFIVAKCIYEQQLLFGWFVLTCSQLFDLFKSIILRELLWQDENGSLYENMFAPEVQFLLAEGESS